MPDHHDFASTWLPEGLIERVRGTISTYRDSVPLLTRLTAHLGIIALVILGLLVSGVEIDLADSAVDTGEDTSTDLPPPDWNQEPSPGDLHIAVIPRTNRSNPPGPEVPPAARYKVVEYTVQLGDTVTRIASRYHVSPESVLWANDKLQDNPDLLSVGQTLNIPPTTGVLHSVKSGDTVVDLASKFKASAQDIFDDPFNQSVHNLKSNPPQLMVGQFLMVPRGQKAIATRPVVTASRAPSGAVKGTSILAWPTAGCIYQSYWKAHAALDIDNVIGTPIYASDSGYVEFAGGGWNYGYGNMVLVNHGNGYYTRYGHLNTINVRAGQSVKKGALVGRMGTTGNSTGSHLHFEVIKSGALVNPVYYVSGRAPARCPGR